MEILNASENLRMTVEQLKDLQKASMVVTYKPNYVYITLAMALKKKEKDIAIPLTVDLGHRSISTRNMNFAVA